MATGSKLYIPSHPGREGALQAADLHHSPARATGGQAAEGYLAAFRVGEMFSKNMFPFVGGGHAYTAGAWTVTTTGTGAAVAGATTAGGGLLLTAGSSSTFNTNLQSLQLWTPVASKRVVVLARVIPSDITTVGYELSIGTSAVDPATTNYTDAVKVKMAVGAGAVSGYVRGNAGTEAATAAAIGTAVAATEHMVGFQFILSATAALCDGGFFYGTDIKALTYTPFTAAQQTQAAAFLTTPLSCYLNLHAKGSAGNPTITFASVLAGVEN